MEDLYVLTLTFTDDNDFIEIYEENPDQFIGVFDSVEKAKEFVNKMYAFVAAWCIGEEDTTLSEIEETIGTNNSLTLYFSKESEYSKTTYCYKINKLQVNKIFFGGYTE